jgi:hypothetical protein
VVCADDVLACAFSSFWSDALTNCFLVCLRMQTMLSPTRAVLRFTRWRPQRHFRSQDSFYLVMRELIGCALFEEGSGSRDLFL